ERIDFGRALTTAVVQRSRIRIGRTDSSRLHLIDVGGRRIKLRIGGRRSHDRSPARLRRLDESIADCRRKLALQYKPTNTLTGSDIAGSLDRAEVCPAGLPHPSVIPARVGDDDPYRNRRR